MQEENGLSQVRLRKYENKLAVSGRAVIAFGLWNIIKAALYFLTQPIDLIKMMGLEEQVKEIGESLSDVPEVNVRFVTSGVFLALMFSYMILAVLLRYYIGRSAILDGRRLKKKSIFYILLAIAMSISLVMSLTPYSLLGMQEETDAAADALNAVITSKLLDITSLMALLDMIISAIRVRQLRKKLGIVIDRKKNKDQIYLLKETGLED